MLAYRIEGIIGESLCKDENDRNAVAEMKHKYANRSEVFNNRFGKNAYIFIADTSEGIITLGAFVTDLQKISAIVDSYAQHMGIQMTDIVISEVTLKKLYGLLSKAESQNFIQDTNEILEEFGLDEIVGDYVRYLEYKEYIVKKGTANLLRCNEAKYWMSDTFHLELQRIFAGSGHESALGHPVHYIIETDDESTRRIMQIYLLRSLYTQMRIRSGRFSCIEVETSRTLNDGTYELLYKASFGGSVVVKVLMEDSEETDYATELNEQIQLICKMLKKYRNQVLTIICLPRECQRLKELFYEELSNVSIVELKEKFVKEKEAERFLENLAEEKQISADAKLANKIQEGKGYLAPELRGIFDSWYDQKLKTEIYPQYQDVLTIKAEEIKAIPKGTAYERLQKMVGITQIKAVIEKALNYNKLQKIYREKGIKTGRPVMHMVFTGNPGTAKTTVARLLAQIMQDNGLLSRGHLVEVGRSDLVGKYVGWTAKCVKEKFKEAKGGVLFIDEAYSLLDDRAGSYGDEAINTIVQEMENHREELVVIFAGYPEKMEEFIQKNPGLRSRIAFHVSFPDYNELELCQIAQLMGKEKGIEFTQEAMGKLRTVFRYMGKKDDFGNGRYVRSMLEQAQMNQAERLLKKDISTITDTELFTITAEDIEIPLMEREERRVIGFAC
ncbi:MAG: AAA family ATPase [Blautia faecis]